MFSLKNMEEDGSKNEILFGRMLNRLGFEFEYEPFTDDIIPTLKGTTGMYKPTQYTPDFLFTINGEKVLVETKGFARPRDHLIMKIADYYYTKKGFKYFVVTTAGTKAKGNRNYYMHKSKGQPKRGVKVKTFWEVIGIQKTQEELHQMWNDIDAEFRAEQNAKRKAERQAEALEIAEQMKREADAQ